MKLHEARGTIFISLLVVMLVGFAMFLPGNMITGNVVSESTCKDAGCTELCDADDECSVDMVCCPTKWDSGICSYPSGCDKIMEYSLYQSLEVYQDSVRNPVESVHADWSRFFLPLLVTLCVIGYFILRRSDSGKI